MYFVLLDFCSKYFYFLNYYLFEELWRKIIVTSFKDWTLFHDIMHYFVYGVVTRYKGTRKSFFIIFYLTQQQRDPFDHTWWRAWNWCILVDASKGIHGFQWNPQVSKLNSRILQVRSKSVDFIGICGFQSLRREHRNIVTENHLPTER